MRNFIEATRRIEARSELVGERLILDEAVGAGRPDGLLVEILGIQRTAFDPGDLRSDQCCAVLEVLRAIRRPDLELPVVRDVDAFHEMKQNGRAYQAPASYKPIHMPKNTAAGFSIALFAFIFGFAAIWHIWWLAGIGFVGMIASVIVRSYVTDLDYYVQPDEIERIENRHFQQLAKQV